MRWPDSSSRPTPIVDGDRSVDTVQWAPAIPDPGAIFTIGANYRQPGEPAGARPDRPMVLGKLPSSVAAHGARPWRGTDRSRPTWTANASSASSSACLARAPETPGHVFGFTIVNDVNSVDPWLDGDHWLLGKSMAGFCPVGPWIVTADELDPRDLRLGATINGEPIQEGTTADMRFTIPEVDRVHQPPRHPPAGRPHRDRHAGTARRPPGPDRHLETGDVVTCWIEGIGELTTTSIV